MIYGLGLTSVCRERFLPGRVRSQGDSDESRKRPWGMIESDMMRPCETNQRSLVVSFAVSKHMRELFPHLETQSIISCHQVPERS